MCFSAEASFAGSIIISAIGVAVVTKVHKPSQLLFACIPLFFGLQQFTEGVLWLTIPNPEYLGLQKFATNLFLVMADVLWPTLIPLSVLMMEENARKKKKEWPKFQLLYDLHPIARWMQFKILAKVDKGKALVIRLRDSIPGQSAWFIFQGISSNGKGKPIMSKSFVVGRSFAGKSIGNLESFNEFVTEYKLYETLQAIEIPVKHIEILQKMLNDAVIAAKNLYKFKIQGDLQDETENNLETYQKKLNNWVQDSERQLELHFGIEEKGIVFLHKERRKRDIKFLQKEMNEFYEEYFQLENEPYLRLLAVFYNA